MISQFFILSQRGDILINKDYRKDIIRESYEVFFRTVKLNKNNNVPIFNIDGINYTYILKQSIFFVLTTRNNSSPSLLLEFLNQIYKIIKDFLGVMTERLIRKNFILIYEILEEMVDFGYPKKISNDSIKDFIFSIPDIDNINVKDNTSLFNNNKKSVNVTYKPITQFKKNEIFIDVIEKINVLFNSELNLLHSSIDGTINIKSYINGNPSIKIGFNHDAYFDDFNFNNNIDDSNFNSYKNLIFKSQTGEFNLMNFRIVKKLDFPFKWYSLVNKLSKFKIAFTIKLRCLIPKNYFAKNVKIKYWLPNSITTSVIHDTSINSKLYKFDYNKQKKEVEWIIENLKGGNNEEELLINFNLKEDIDINKIKKEIGSIKLNFEIKELNLSNVKIKYVNISETEFNVNKWIRYICTSDSYITRV